MSCNSWRAQLVVAQGDGVQPAAALTVGSSQYLFNVPEGFSRLVLEHKCRPGSALRAIFATGLQPAATGGLSGSLLRLKADGHEQLRLLGPAGLCAIAHVLRYSIFWEHPRILASECRLLDAPTVYKDEAIHVVALIGAPPVWPCPVWLGPSHADSCQQPEAAQHASPAASASSSESAEQDADSSDDEAAVSQPVHSQAQASSSDGDMQLSGYSSVSSSDDDHAADQAAQPHARPGRSVGNAGKSSIAPAYNSMSHSNAPKPAVSEASQPEQSRQQQRQQQQQQNNSATSSGDSSDDASSSAAEHAAPVSLPPAVPVRQTREGAFCALDQLFYGRPAYNGRMRLGALEILEQQRSIAMSRQQIQPGSMKDTRKARGTLLREPIGQPRSNTKSRRRMIVANAQQAQANAQANKELTHARAEAKRKAEKARQVSYGLMPGSSNALYVRKQAGSTPDSCSTAGDTVAPLWGYLCRLHTHQNKQLLLVVCCSDHKAVTAASSHPVLGHLSRSSHRVAAVLHLTPASVCGSVPYRAWLKSLPGKQVLLSHRKTQGEPGHVHAACAQLQLATSAAASSFLPPHSLSWLAADQQGRQRKRRSYSQMQDCQHIMKAGLLTSIGGDDRGVYMSREHCPWMPAQGGDPTAAEGQDGQLKTPALAHALAKRVCECQEEAGSNRPAAKRLKASLNTPSPTRSSHLQGPCAGTATSPGVQHVAGNAASCIPAQDRLPAAHSRQYAAQDDYRPMCLEGAREVRVTFLGTGAAEPSKHRAPSAIHIQVSTNAGLLLDAGEGTWGAFQHFWGSEQALAKVSQLQAVWISHKHADHMMGLAGILHARPPSTPPLLVMGPAAVKGWLREAAPHMGLRYKYISCALFSTKAQPPPDITSLLASNGIRSWQSVPVKHCRDAWGLAIRAHAGWSIAYSGDTRPCPAFAQAARGVSLLIHEATFEQDLQEHAQSKLHSTVDEAVFVAAESGAYRTVLTHFSQRYPHLPAGIPCDGRMADKVVAAFDGMSFALAELHKLAGINSIMQQMFLQQQMSTDRTDGLREGHA